MSKSINQPVWHSGKLIALIVRTNETGLAFGAHRRVFSYDRKGGTPAVTLGTSVSARLVIVMDRYYSVFQPFLVLGC